MSKYKLIALDMDGTLLNSDKKISERNCQAIIAAKKQGVNVVLASGRPLAGLRHYFEQLGMTTEDDYVISFNGVMVQRIHDGMVLNSQMMTGKDAKIIARFADQHGLNIHAFSPIRGLISPKGAYYSQHEAEINKIELNLFDFYQLSDDEPIIKVLVAEVESTISAIRDNLPHELRQQFTIVQSSPHFLEFLNPQANKGYGVACLAKHLGIQADEIICMGDAGNDLHMIQFAGLGIAMENASEDIKAIAQHITAHHNEDGVAQAIEHFILHK